MRRLLKSRTILITTICLAALIFAWLGRSADYGVMQDLRNITFDGFQRIKPRPPTQFSIKIVDIDEESIAKYGQWPWPRTKMAEMVNRLTQAGAAVIAFDILFSEPDRSSPKTILQFPEIKAHPDFQSLSKSLSTGLDYDLEFAKSLSNSNSVLPFFATTETTVNKSKPMAGYAFLGNDPKPVLQSLPATIGNLPVLTQSAKGLGNANPDPNIRDDIIRRVPMFVTVDGQIYPNLGLEALRVAFQASSFTLKATGSSSELDTGQLAMTHGKVGDFIFPVTNDGQLQVYYSKQQPARYLSAASTLEADLPTLSAAVEGHIVFIGTSAAGLRDIRTNALGEIVPGVSVHAEIVDQILDQKFLIRPDIATGIEKIMMVVATLIIIALVPFLSAVQTGLVGVMLTGAILATSWFAFSWYGWLIDPSYPAIAFVVIFLLATLLMYAMTEREKKFVRGAFQQYLAPDLLHKLEQNPEMLKLGGEIRHMTIMFMDIRGFTPISEQLSPEELVTFLNKLLSPLTDIILKHEGAIDKYIGDSIMAFWNAPLDVKDHPSKAALAALEMIEETKRMNARDAFGFKSAKLGLGDVQIGIGMSTGKGCVGNLGSTSRFDYSVVGDTVNVASRVESSCKAVGWPILLAEATAQECPDMAYLQAGEIALKGKSKPQQLYALIGDTTVKNSVEFTNLQHHHKTLLRALQTALPPKETTRLRDAFKHNSPEEMADFIDNLGAS